MLLPEYVKNAAARIMIFSIQLLGEMYKSWPRGYKTFFVLNSVEHEILNAHKYKNIKKFGLFKAQLSLE